ncbi:MAG TPA: exodeoxyribonuclease VII large subunit [Thermomicrobiales bacterium]|nr:exodeoxyribonuclease VII large subunit [Thermomicrobiales bacterium]
MLPISLLTSYLKEVLESDALLSDIWVEGEVSHVFRAGSGHVYFTLQDSGSTLKCVLFRAVALLQRHLPTAGTSVVVHGRVALYDRDSTIQLYADVVQPAGVGIQALQLEQLRQQLEAEGLFDPSRKRPLPLRPKVIGVVTSADGAVWHDIQQVLRRRYPLVEVVLAPATVQGEEAPARLVEALAAMQAYPGTEVIIFGRGGGATEDLAAFNTEAVARAVFACRVPVVSAVGHETDWTMTDWVADVRASTPSVAAELCVPSMSELREDLAGYREQLDRIMHHAWTGAREEMIGQRRRLLRVDTPNRPMRDRRALLQHRQRLIQAAETIPSRKRQEVDTLGGMLELLNPRRVLGRGYAVVTDAENRSPVVSAGDARARRSLRLHFHDAALDVRPTPEGSLDIAVGEST